MRTCLTKIALLAQNAKQHVPAYMQRLAQHPRIHRFAEQCDTLIQTVSHRQYTGDNPAIAAVYAPLRHGLIAMGIAALVIFGFGSFVPIESATVASGTIAIVSNKKTVQHLEGGVIRRILVKEGDTVKAGDSLIELNDVAPKANRNIARSELYAAQVTEARLIALKEGEPDLVIAEPIRKAAKSNASLAKAIATQADLFETQQRTQRSKLKTMQQRVRQYEEEIEGLKAQVKSADGQLALIAQEIVPMRKLVKRGFAAKPQLLALERHREELEGNRGQYLAAIAKAKQGITEAKLEITTLKSDFVSRISDELREAQNTLNDAQEKLNATSDVVQRAIIASPYEGVVTGLKYHTEGGVITPGTPIMDIIPQHETLLIEARVAPQDRDVIRPGMSARIFLSAYSTRSLPKLPGKLTHISADSLADPQNNQVPPYYMAKVEVDAKALAQLEHPVTLAPGMPVEVFIRTGARSFIGYLLAPITHSMDRAFRED